MLLLLRCCQQRGKEALEGLQGVAQALVVALVMAVAVVALVLAVVVVALVLAVVVVEVVVDNFSSLNKVVHTSRHHNLLLTEHLSRKVCAFLCGVSWRPMFGAAAQDNWLLVAMHNLVRTVAARNVESVLCIEVCT